MSHRWIATTSIRSKSSSATWTGLTSRTRCNHWTSSCRLACQHIGETHSNLSPICSNWTLNQSWFSSPIQFGNQQSAAARIASESILRFIPERNPVDRAFRPHLSERCDSTEIQRCHVACLLLSPSLARHSDQWQHVWTTWTACAQHYSPILQVNRLLSCIPAAAAHSKCVFFVVFSQRESSTAASIDPVAESRIGFFVSDEPAIDPVFAAKHWEFDSNVRYDVARIPTSHPHLHTKSYGPFCPRTDQFRSVAVRYHRLRSKCGVQSRLRGWSRHHADVIQFRWERHWICDRHAVNEC